MPYTLANTAEGLARNITNLVSFPDIAFRFDEIAMDDRSDISHIGRLLESDPAFSVAILRLANSALFNRGYEFTSVTAAITAVGLREARNLTFGICSARAFEGIPNELVSMADFWRHSISCAVAARKIGEILKLSNADSLFSGGLLHDIGQLAMFCHEPERSRKALTLSIDLDTRDALLQSERDVFGFDHMQVGAALARVWNFPPALCQCIEYHHNPYEADIPTDALLVVHIANCVSVLVELCSTNLDDGPQIDERAMKSLKLDESDLLSSIESIHEDVELLIRSFIT